ncbi:NAD-dependent epimerase/dehydratase family protein [Hazenella coriacea]|uniref:Nucleoside-diphosphate-sugar epimerase n=1 Tax=Hazenella coriacea TaxID=1179467 RepID=A0A4V2UVS5_9BACL|nr:NAD-dependent epimerase/dehydratase family protein [Hazenella coriacea]TCS96857.1 nucleoside-diphosphate-sugar epimerase [Hazenella coriacea]
MKALVTGTTGFLGYALATRLHQMGWQVTATGRNQSIGEELVQQGISFVPADLNDQPSVMNLCQGQEVVFHCAALSSPWGPYQRFYEANVLGTRHIIQGCQEQQVKRLVHVSTPSIYFRFKDQLNISEQDPLPAQKVNAYAETKWLAEQEMDQAFQDGLSVVTIRPRALFGPRDQAIIPRLLKANEQRFIPLINGGQVWLDVTYVENVVDACLLCVESPTSTLGKKYNITNGEPMLLIELLEKVFAQLDQPMRTKKISFPTAYRLASMLEFLAKTIGFGKEPTLTKYTVGLLGMSQTLDISAAKTELGYQPRISIEEGLEEFIRWWRTQS